MYKRICWKSKSRVDSYYPHFTRYYIPISNKSSFELMRRNIEVSTQYDKERLMRYNMILRNADALKNDYTVYASFYKIDINNTEVLCRNVCDIKRNDISKDNEIDAYIILMNPGSCHPLDSEYEIRKYNNWEELDVNMVRCQADQAQYQIMKLMDNKLWDCVRVINLSDIVMGNSKKFMDFIRTIPYDSHSLFSNNRKEDRKKIMKHDAKIIASWGQNKRLEYLAELCKSNINSEELLGIPSDKKKLLYKYIKPMLVKHQVELLEELNAIL